MPMNPSSIPLRVKEPRPCGLLKSKLRPLLQRARLSLAVKAAAKNAGISEKSVGTLIRDDEWTLETEWDDPRNLKQTR